MTESGPRFALSIQQPWAYAILHLGKTVENRTWPTKVRGRIVIHASKRIDPWGVLWMQMRGYAVPYLLPTGGYVGTVVIGDCLPIEQIANRDHWMCGPYCFTLHLPEAYDEIIPARGRIGFFKVES